MRAKNAYFQLTTKEDGTYLKLYSSEPGGQEINYDELRNYLIDKKIYEFDKKALGKALVNLKNETEVKLTSAMLPPQDEAMKVIIDKGGMYAGCRFYPPSNNGKLLTKDDIISNLSSYGVKYGIDETNIVKFLNDRRYCTDYIIAKATPPIQGRDAVVKYHFNTDFTLKPKTNEDGSVDFHQLDIISHCKKGDILASLTPADYGKPGMDVYGKVLPPNKVNNKVLKYGNKVKISEDGLTLYSEVDGHVTLIDGRVFVSDTFEIPKNVDTSTGDIDYDGNVIIKGNVITGFTVKAKGDIEVYGVVEGAYIEAGGHVILRRGMQGMNKGILKAQGNIITKFIENAEVIAGGYINTNSILHSKVSAKGDIIVSGRRGFVTGGMIRSGTLISVKTAGSHMGTNTILEVGVDPKVLDEFRELEKKIATIESEKEKVAKAVETIRKRIQSGADINYDRLDKLKKLTQTSLILNAQLKEVKSKYDILKLEIEANEQGMISISDTVYPGTKIVISNTIYHVKEKIHNSKFIRDRADIKVIPLY
ncbi:DUF342 domain-containing protein [Herbinix luporum]|jgi:uncharacterized protein (DUF342 family)|uniref:DUF342 domain-containing protein n=1 Tax=Herbinix luporum TaxID=1679721 RepID=UPI0023F42759|nr:FapA family protein [Herbinix luporum]MDI9489230.1 FapA family protein [Bacillota bacterium]